MAKPKFRPKSHEHDFVDEPDEDFFCKVSKELLLEPYQTQCCGNHLSGKVAQARRDCPICKTTTEYGVVLDKYHQKKVQSLKVRCSHKEKGCKWVGALGSLQIDHIDKDCQYVEVQCRYSGCGEVMQRRFTDEHMSNKCALRPFACQYCDYNDSYRNVTEKHWPICKKYPLPCPNECDEKTIERQNLEGHLKQTCPLQLIPCEFKSAGCRDLIQRQDMAAHMKAYLENHLSMTGKHVENLEEKVTSQGSELKVLKQCHFSGEPWYIGEVSTKEAYYRVAQGYSDQSHASGSFLVYDNSDYPKGDCLYKLLVYYEKKFHSLPINFVMVDDEFQYFLGGEEM